MSGQKEIRKLYGFGDELPPAGKPEISAIDDPGIDIDLITQYLEGTITEEELNIAWQTRLEARETDSPDQTDTSAHE